MNQSPPARREIGSYLVELETLARIETGDLRGEGKQLNDYVDLIRSYQHFIYVKLSRAIGSRASEELETGEEMKGFPKDFRRLSQNSADRDRSLNRCVVGVAQSSGRR